MKSKSRLYFTFTSSDKGFILLGLMLLLPIVFGLSMMMSQLVSENTRTNQHKKRLIQLQEISDVILANIEHHLLDLDDHCFKVNLNAITNDPSWKNASCSDNLRGFRYYYAVEALGYQECDFINHSDSKRASFYRILLEVYQEASEQRVKTISTFAYPVQSANNCTQEKRYVSAGRQMRRAI